MESPSWYSTCQAGVLLSHALRDYGTDVPDNWKWGHIDNDGDWSSQLQVNDGATTLSQDSSASGDESE